MTESADAYESFEALGEAGVREHIAAGRYNQRKRKLALHWVEEKDQGRRDSALARSDVSQAEEIAIARSAKDAAWVAADAARQAAREAISANRIAKAALIMAVAAIAVSIILAA